MKNIIRVLAFFLAGIFAQNAGAQMRCERSLMIAPTAARSKSRVVIVSGTNRDQSNTLKIAEEMKIQLEDQGAFVEILDLSQVPVSTYSGTNYFNTPKVFQKNYDQKIAQADHVVVVVPEYHGSFPGILKTFFDYVQTPLESKNISLIGISAGAWGGRVALHQFSETLLHRKANVWGVTRINVPQVEKVFQGDRLTDLSIRERMRMAATNIVNSKVAVGNENRVSLEKLQKMTGLEMSALYELNSGIKIQGLLTKVITDSSSSEVSYLQFQGRTSIRDSHGVLPGQGEEVHHEGFGMPVGKLKKIGALSQIRSLEQLGFQIGEKLVLEYQSGVRVEGTLDGVQVSTEGQLQILKFSKTTVTLGDQILFDPSWGAFDLAIGESVSGVHL